MHLLFSYRLTLFGIPLLMALPYYFLNRYLVRKLKPRENPRKLLFYFGLTFLIAFVYISIGIFLIMRLALYFK